MDTGVTHDEADAGFEVGAQGVDVERIVADIREKVAARMRNGEYPDPAISRAELANLANLRNEDEFLDFYLNCLRDSCYVDINDFEIVERRAIFRRGSIALKKSIWKLLKFYTYRLWSQQNQINGLFLSTVELTDNRYRDKIRLLEERVAAIEKRLGEQGGASPTA